MQHKLLARVVGVNALLAFAWLIVGGLWIFDEDSDCADEAPALCASSENPSAISDQRWPRP